MGWDRGRTYTRLGKRGSAMVHDFIGRSRDTELDARKRQTPQHEVLVVRQAQVERGDVNASLESVSEVIGLATRDECGTNRRLLAVQAGWGHGRGRTAPVRTTMR